MRFRLAPAVLPRGRTGPKRQQKTGKFDSTGRFAQAKKLLFSPAEWTPILLQYGMSNPNEYCGVSRAELSRRIGIRKRPAMYIGGTDSRGLNQLVIELLDNAADQFLAGRATQFDVQIDGRLAQISDDGPGLPFDVPYDTAVSLAEHYLTSIHNKPTADGHAPHVHSNGSGLGMCIVAALTDHLVIDSWRNGQHWQQTYWQGEPTGRPNVSERGAITGTTFCLSPDPLIFKDRSFDLNALRRQFRITSHLLPGFRLTLQEESFYAPEGLAEWCAAIVGRHHQTPPLTVNCRVGDYHVQAAAAGVAAKETEWHSFANGFETVLGGTHLAAFKRLLGYQWWKPAAALLHVTMMTPRYAGPTRGGLDVPEIYAPMKQALSSAIRDYCRQHRLGRYA